MRRHLRARGLLLLLPLVLVGCGDISLDNLGDFVVTYKVTVEADLSEDVLVSLSTPDVERRAAFSSGAITATSFKPGVVTVRAGNPEATRAAREITIREIERILATPDLNPDAAKELRDQLLALRNVPNDAGAWATCTFEVKPGPQPSGGDHLVYSVGYTDTNSIKLSGPGC